MSTPKVRNLRRLTRHALALSAAGFIALAANVATTPGHGPEPLEPPTEVRTLSISRSLPDRLGIQQGVTAATSEEPFIRVVTASATAPPPPPRPRNPKVCIASPLEPGSFRISSAYGNRTTPISGVYGLHAGVDLAAPMDTPIHAVADGVVVYTGAGQSGRSSEMIIIDHEVDGIIFSSWYVHMYPHGVFVKAGQRVHAGEKIAAVGSNGFSTGPHLHLEIHTPAYPSGAKGMSLGHLLPTQISELSPESEDEGPDEDLDEELDLVKAEVSGEQPPEESVPAEDDPGDSAAEVDTQVPDNDAPPGESDQELPSEDNPASEQPEDEESNTEDSSDEDSNSDPQEADLSESGDPLSETDDELEANDQEDSESESDEIQIEEDDDQGKNDHVLEGIVEDDDRSRTTGIFDRSSLGMLHDPIPFLKALGYGFVAPSQCWA